MARSGLRLDLRAALHKAATTGRIAVQNKVGVVTSVGRQEIDLFVQPLRYQDTPDALYMVVFQDLGAFKTTPTRGHHDRG